MPSGLNNRTDNSDAILGQILAGVKKLPGNALGAPVDLVNSALNVAKAAYGYAGSKVGILGADDLPAPIDNPIGGSQYINSKFGLGSSTGTADDITQFLGGFISPESGAVASAKLGLALKSVILPAALIHDSSTVDAAARLISKGADPKKIYDITGMFPSEDRSGAPIMKTVLPDIGATLQPVGGVLRTSAPNPYYNGPSSIGSTTVKLPADFQGKLSDVLDHPTLFAAMPELADINVRSQSGSGASYTGSDNTITLGPVHGTTGMTDVNGNVSAKYNVDADNLFTSVLLHETQHAIQQSSGFLTGGNPGMFLRDKTGFNQAAIKADSISRDPFFPGLADQATQDSKVLAGVRNQANENYMNIGGEQEARIVQQQFETGNYSVSPGKTLENLNAGGETTIKKPLEVPKLDDDPAVNAIIQYYTNPQAGP